MRFMLTAATAGALLLAGGSIAQAQHGHGGFGHGGFGHGGFGHGGFGHGGFGHGGFGHGGFGHGHGFGHIDFYGYGHYHGYPSYGYYGYYPSYTYPSYAYPSVVVTRPVVVGSSPVVVGSTTVEPVTSSIIRPNPASTYSGPGVTIRLPADLPGPVYLNVDGREVEVRPGAGVVLKDKGSFQVEYDRGGDFGTAKAELSEGAYRLVVGDKGWQVVPDAPAPAAATPRRNALPPAIDPK